MIILIGIFILLTGIYKILASINLGKQEKRKGNFLNLLRYLLGHKPILKGGGWRGAFHIIIFYGIMFHLLIVLISQIKFEFKIPIITAAISFFTDLIGILMLIGVILFIGFQYINKPKKEDDRVKIFALLIFLATLIFGFMAEGTRLKIIQANFDISAPIGYAFSFISPDSPLLMQLMIRLHFFTAIVFFVTIPFTFMSHFFTSSMNVYYKYNDINDIPYSHNLLEGKIGANTILDFSWKQLLDSEACISCKRCEQNCPPFIAGKGLSPRRIINLVKRQKNYIAKMPRKDFKNQIYPEISEEINTDELWACTLCLACFETCPVYIPTFDKVAEIRKDLVMMKSQFYPELKALFRNIEMFGDTFGKGTAYRTDWLSGLPINKMSEIDSTEYLFWVGCQATFHDKGKLDVASLARIFKNAGISFAILGQEELCCGDPLRRVGNEYLFQKIANYNIEKLRSYNINRIVTYCPHCYNMLKNEYPYSDESFEVLHYTELISDLIKNDSLTLKKELKKRLLYHDPCYLARANGLIDAPREILNAIPGVVTIEARNNGRNTFCCGAGGGHMWMREGSGDKINELRAQEIVKKEPDMIVTACPYCLVMFNDALKNLEMDLKAYDVAEIISTLT